MGEQVQHGRSAPSLFAGHGAVGWGLVGSAAYGLFQWLTLVVLARTGTPALVGRFTLGLALTAPVIMFANMQLGWLQATDQSGLHPFRDYRDQRFAALVGAALVILGLTQTASDPTDRLVILLVGVCKMIESLSDLCIGNFQRHSRLDLVARSQTVRGFLSVAFFSVTLALSQDLTLALVAMAVAWFFALAIHDWPTNRRLPDRFDPSQLTEPARKRILHLTASALPLGIAALLVSLNTSVPRLVIERSLGRHELGIFAAMAYLVVAGRMIASPFAQMMAPRLGAAVAAGDRARFQSQIGWLVMVAGALGGVGVVIATTLGREVLTLLYGPEYAREVGTFVILMVGSTLGYVALFLQIGSTAARMLRGQVLVVICSVVATAVVAWVAVPRSGVVGGAIGMLAGAAVELIGGALLLRLSLRRVGARLAGPIAAPVLGAE